MDKVLLSLSPIVLSVIVFSWFIYAGIMLYRRGGKFFGMEIKERTDKSNIKIKYTWEKDDVAVRIRGPLVQTFGIMNSDLHAQGLSAIREQWPSKKYECIVFDITDSNVPSPLLGIISASENQKVKVLHRADQIDEVTVLKAYTNIELYIIN